MKFAIAAVNDPDVTNPEHWIPCSVRKPRAIRKARQLKKMLFVIDDRTGQKHPISTKLPKYVPSKGEGCNSTFIGGS